VWKWSARTTESSTHNLYSGSSRLSTKMWFAQKQSNSNALTVFHHNGLLSMCSKDNAQQAQYRAKKASSLILTLHQLWLALVKHSRHLLDSSLILQLILTQDTSLPSTNSISSLCVSLLMLLANMSGHFLQRMRSIASQSCLASTKVNTDRYHGKPRQLTAKQKLSVPGFLMIHRPRPGPSLCGPLGHLNTMDTQYSILTL
jgi:hypothetical protein